MKFNNVLFEMLNEEFANKKLLNAMIIRWFGPDATEEEKIEVDNLLSKFFEIKNRLSLKSAEVKTFLNKFEGFDPQKIKEITSYTLAQVKFILNEYFDFDEDGFTDEMPEVLRGKDLPPTEDRIKASKSLWYTKNSNLIIEGDGFRVYKILNRRDSIAYGYYEGHVASSTPYKEYPNHMQWCTTRHIENSNLYGNYRSKNDGRTFYFVIDESKHPSKEPNIQVSQYYLSALQYSLQSPTKYRITSILNDGTDPVFTENEIYKIYPQLNGHLDKIVPVDYSQEELGTITDNLDKVDERDNNEYAFFKINTKLKKRYVDSGKSLTKAKSWDSMSSDLKTAYVDIITSVTNLYEKFGTKELLDIIKSSNEDFKKVDRRVKILGLPGFGSLLTKVMQTEFIADQRKSLTKDYISLFENRRTKKFGIFNKEMGEWLQRGGIQYSDLYTKIDDDVYLSDTGEAFVIEVYSITNTPDDKSFYIVIPVDDSINGYFVSAQKWKELQTKLHPEDGGEGEFEPEQDSDIQEKYKGV